MAIQLSVGARNDRLNQFETTVGTSAILEIRSGAQPADCATADSGTLLASLPLPSDWLAAASAGSKAKSGTWQDTSANGTGTAAHFRIKDNPGTTCHMQGSVGTSGTDMIIDNTSIATGQQVTVTAFSITDANA